MGNIMNQCTNVGSPQLNSPHSKKANNSNENNKQSDSQEKTQKSQQIQYIETNNKSTYVEDNSYYISGTMSFLISEQKCRKSVVRATLAESPGKTAESPNQSNHELKIEDQIYQQNQIFLLQKNFYEFNILATFEEASPGEIKMTNKQKKVTQKEAWLIKCEHLSSALKEFLEGKLITIAIQHQCSMCLIKKISEFTDFIIVIKNHKDINTIEINRLANIEVVIDMPQKKTFNCAIQRSDVCLIDYLSQCASIKYIQESIIYGYSLSENLILILPQTFELSSLAEIFQNAFQKIHKQFSYYSIKIVKLQLSEKGSFCYLIFYGQINEINQEMEFQFFYDKLLEKNYRLFEWWKKKSARMDKFKDLFNQFNKAFLLQSLFYITNPEYQTFLSKLKTIKKELQSESKMGKLQKSHMFFTNQKQSTESTSSYQKLKIETYDSYHNPLQQLLLSDSEEENYINEN